MSTYEKALTIADAENVLDKLNEHWTAVQGQGVTKAEVEGFKTVIERANGLTAKPESLSLEDLRSDYKNRLGELRRKGAIIAHNFRGTDAMALKDFDLKREFPDNDIKLQATAKVLPKLVKKYSGKLTQRGFDKSAQEELLAAATSFVAGVKAVPKKKGKKAVASKNRGDVFAELRRLTTYFRTAGRNALINDATRTGFDRVTSLPSKKATKKEPASKTPAGADNAGTSTAETPGPE